MSKKLNLLFITLLAIIITSFCFSALSQATDTSWLTDQLNLTQQSTYELPQDSDTLAAIGINKIPCHNTTFITRPEKKIGASLIQTKQETTVCAYSTSAGMYGGGYFLATGTSVAGKIKSQLSTSSTIIPVPDSAQLIELVSAGGTAQKVYIYDNATANLSVSKDSQGIITYTLPTNYSLIKNTSGSILYIDYNTLRISNNGQWVVADGLNSGFVRIGLEDKTTLSFTTNLSTSSSTVYSLNAISDDGRYAVIAVPAVNNKRFIIYDLNTCVGTSLIKSCASRNLLQAIQTISPSYYATIGAANFINDSLLEFYGSYDYISTSNYKFGVFTLSTDGQSYTKVNYLGLGDSFSSGEGAYSYRPETDISDNRCHTSTLNYGYLLKSLANTGTFQSVACSGAKIQDYYYSGRESDYNLKKAPAKNKSDTDTYDSEIYGNFLPGYRLQNNFVYQNKPQIITMSMGGNDVGFADIIKSCVLSFDSDCYQTYEDRKELANTINSQYPRLVDMYQKLKTSSPEARIYIIGYPQIAVDDGNCAANVHLTSGEITFGNQLTNYLNYVIKTAADDTGVFYVDTEDTFAGHRLCETGSPNVIVHGLTYLEGGPLARESYHPTNLGQQALARRINNVTNGLTASMPALSGRTTYTEPDDANVPLLANAPHDNRTINNTLYSPSAVQDILYKNSNFTIDTSAEQTLLQANSVATVTIHSTPTLLGTATVNSQGILDANFALPSNLETGYHTIYISAKNASGDDIVLTKIVYVGETVDDIDGDGVVDSNELCVGIEPSGIDTDQDGLDDSCDNYIGEAPVVSSSSTPTASTNSNSPTQLDTVQNSSSNFLLISSNGQQINVNNSSSGSDVLGTNTGSITSVSSTATSQSKAPLIIALIMFSLLTGTVVFAVVRR